MLVVVCCPGESPQSCEIEDTLEAMQVAVGGNIERVVVPGPLAPFDVYVNEDGRDALPFNRALGPHRLFGPILVSKANDEGEQVSLSLDEVPRVIAALEVASVWNDTPFAKWLDTFLEEKGVDCEETLLVDGPTGTFNVMPVGIVVDLMKQTSPGEQRVIKNTFVKIDFCNGDVRHYIAHLAKAVAR